MRLADAIASSLAFSRAAFTASCFLVPSLATERTVASGDREVSSRARGGVAVAPRRRGVSSRSTAEAGAQRLEGTWSWSMGEGVGAGCASGVIEVEARADGGQGVDADLVGGQGPDALSQAGVVGCCPREAAFARAILSAFAAAFLAASAACACAAHTFKASCADFCAFARFCY